MSEVAEQKRLEIPWIRSLGSALGAVSAAVLLSTWGAAGTLVGAAVGSLCITVGGAMYAHSLELTKEQAAKAHAGAMRRVTRTRSVAMEDAEGRSQGLADSEAADQTGRDKSPSVRSTFGESLRGLRWRPIIIATGGVFAVAMGIILAFELSAGRAVSTFTGGSSDTAAATSIPGFSGLSDVGVGADEQDQQESGTEPDEAPVPGEDADSETEPDQAPQDGQVSEPSEGAPVAPAPTAEQPEQPADPADPQQ